MKKLGEFIIDRAFNELNQLSIQLPGIFSDYSDFFISINLSARQFLYADFLEKIKTAIEKYKINPTNIMFEISEHALMPDP